MTVQAELNMAYQWYDEMAKSETECMTDKYEYEEKARQILEAINNLKNS